MKRKIYDKLLEWKKKHKGNTALLIEGARRIGKSYIVEEFAHKEYASYVLDFSHRGKVRGSVSPSIAPGYPHLTCFTTRM